MSNSYEAYGRPVVTGPPLNAVDLTALLSDTVDLPRPMRVQVRGTAGNVRFVPAGSGATVLTLALAAKEFVECQVIRVHATGTTATSLVGYY
jgi:hypothetical protein